MSNEDFKKAIAILSEENSVKVSFNVPITDNYSSTYKILIHECNAHTINSLIADHFSLSMNPKGLAVDKY